MQPSAPPQDVNYPSAAARGLAITQMVLGLLSIICGVVAVVLYRYWWVYTGALEIWMPITFVVAGIFGILAANQRSHGMIVAHMVMSIVSSVAAFVVFVCACIYAVFLGPHLALVFFSFAEIVVSIISAVFCCRAVCCRSGSTPGVVVMGQAPPGTVIVTTTGPPGGAVMYNQQYVAHPGAQPVGYPAMQPTGYAPMQPGMQYPAQHEYAAPQYVPPQQQQDTKPPPY